MIGETISHYKIVEKIGEGGMGVVYKARDIKLKRSVALKFLPVEFTKNPEARKRFVREAQAAAALNSPNIVTIHEINEHEGSIYIVMEYVEGDTLREKKQAEDADKTRKIDTGIPDIPLPGPGEIENIIETAIQISRGLKAAHNLGIVHRDIKPQNIIINKEGVAKILDFGIAKLSTMDTKATDEFSTMGTVYYMSPDHLSGKEVDRRTDIWSLGVLLYEMLSNQLPFKEENIQGAMYAIVHEDPIPPGELNSNIPGKLESITLKCLQKNRDDRYQTAEELLADLEKSLKALRKKSSETRIKKKKPVKKETERRQATVIAAEICGYSELMGKFDTEEAAYILSSCSELFTAVVEKYGGRIDKITEGSLVAHFGVPMAIENAPQKAVNAAIEMRNNLNKFCQESKLKISLDTRFGINTGTVIAAVIGKDDREEYTVMGDTIILASQLKELSAAGQIFVGQPTYRYTRDEFEYKAAKPVSLKGQSKPVPVYELLSTKEKIYRPGIDAERMIYSEMVGRDKELDKLRLQVLKVVNGEGSTVSVVSEAGIGKSRLIAELKKMEDIKKVTLLEGRALSIGKNLSYHPIIDILKNWAHIKEEDSEAETLKKLEVAISHIYPEGTAEIFPFVATMMGMKLTGKHAERIKGIEGEAMEKLILKNFREFIAKAAENRTLVIIIEDLHWADVSSIELLESLYRLVTDHRIMVINVLRPNYKETGDRILQTLRQRYKDFHLEIHLTPLDDKQCETLIHNLMKVKKLPAETKAAVANRAEGNPFYIEEVVRSFIDEGIVELKNGKFKITEKIESVELPETIQDVIMARIDRLDEEAKTLLKEASVIGRHFFYKILVEVTENIEDIDEILEYLKGIQFISERTRLGEVEYFFTQTLVQEVTYESILQKKRKELHLKVANAIEIVFPGRLHEFYGMLALHYSRGENLEKAEEYLIKAGEEALKAAASYEAVTYYQEALTLYLKKYADALNHEKLARLERKIALAYYNKGYYVEAEKHFGKVLEYWGVKSPGNKIIALFYTLIHLLILFKNLYLPSRKAKRTPSERDNDIFEVTYQRGTTLGSIDVVRLVMDSIRILRDLYRFDLSKVRNGIAIFAASSALFSYTALSFPIARRLLDYAQRYIEEDDIRTRAKYNAWEMIYDSFSGNWARKLVYDESVVDMFLQDGDFFYASSALLFAGIIMAERGDLSDAEIYINKLHEIGETYENDYARDLKYILNTRVLLKTRKLTDALSEAETGIAYSRRVEQNPSLMYHFGVKANVQILSGDMPGAVETLQQGEAVAAQDSQLSPMHFNVSSYNISRFLLDIYNLEMSIYTGDKSRTAELLKKANRSGKTVIKTGKKYAPFRIEVFRLMGIYYWLTGRQKKALHWWGKSIQNGQQLGDQAELARTYMEVGKRLLEKNSKFTQYQGIKADEYLQKALAIFKEKEMTWDIDELDKIKNQAAL